jgi:hypothetical protein
VSNHTPTPWHIESDGPSWNKPSLPTTIRWKPPTGNDYLRSDQMGDYRGVIVCDMTEGHGDRAHAATESWANARLIAAAPDLLNALQTLVAHFDDSRHDFDPCARAEAVGVARAAISNATGQPVKFRDDDRAEVLRSSSSA